MTIEVVIPSSYALLLIWKVWCLDVCSLDVVVFWQHVWSSTSTGGDAYPGVALVPGACCHSPCLGVDTLPSYVAIIVCL